VPVAGQTVQVVLPQLSEIPEAAIYRKYKAGEWRTFVEDEHNRLASAPGDPGFCPPPGDAAYTPGLTAGHWCVQLAIEDGGANDGDDLANNTIQDPGGVAVKTSESANVTSSGGGGSIDTLLLISLLGVVSLTFAGGIQAGEWRIGAMLGRADGETGTRQINKQLRDAGLDAQASSSDNRRTAWQIRLGYEFTPNWGLELGYLDLGDVETRFTGSTVDIDAFLEASRDIHPNTADGALLSGVYSHPLGSLSWIKGVARAGLFTWSSEYKIDAGTSSYKVDENGTDFSFGLGLKMDLEGLGALPPGLSTQLEWQRFDIDGEDTDLFSVGINYGF
jgi:hypothetical protein